MSNLTYLIVYNAHNGESLNIPKPIRFHSLVEFKKYLSQEFNIDNINYIFLLTTFGIKLNFNLINELTDVYVFDKRLFGNNGQEFIINYFKQDIMVKPMNYTMPDTKNEREMIGNLKNNQGWTRSIVQTSNVLEERISVIIKQINIIFKSLNIIFQFGTNFINDIEKNFVNYFNHIKLINMKTLHLSWQNHLTNLKKFPVFEIQDLKINFSNLLKVDRLTECSDYIGTNLPLIIEKFNQMNQIIESVNQDKILVDKSIETLRNESIVLFKNIDSNELLTNLNEQSTLLINDIDKISTSPTLVNISEIYQTHKLQYCFKIYQIINQLYDYYESLNKFKHHLITDSIKIFQNIANLQMKMVSIKDDLKVLTQDSEKVEGGISFKTINQINRYEDYLSLTIDLPLLFGFLVIERRRQFEWYDFYSKGIVANVTEQLTNMIDHERLFRTIWNKKFGNFLNLITDNLLQIQLPNLDVTLVAGKPQQEEFNILKDLIIERKDITGYITLLDKSNVSKNFVDLLNTNYQDLISSTNNMKKVTKVISSLSTYTSISKEDKLKIIQRGEDSQDLDFDLKLINGLKSRIKKLENLLHQQQYKNLSNWPVTTTVNGDNKASMIMDRTRKSPSPHSNPKQLLPSNSSTTEKSTTQTQKVLDTTGLDKHLDNIRLKKEIAEIMNQNRILLEENNRIKNENQDLVEENADLTHKNENLSKEKSSFMKSKTGFEDKIEDLQNENKLLKNQLTSNKKDFEEKLDKKEETYRLLKLDVKIDAKEIESLNKKLEQKNEKLDELEQKLSEIKSLNNSSESGYDKLKSRIGVLEEELSEAKTSKDDLFSNMSSKEAEYTKERNALESEIKELKFKLDNLQLKSDEVTEDYENLMELTHSKEKNNDLLTNDLNNIIITLLSSVRRLVEHDFDAFLEFCLVLESMGLLLIKENKEYKITRVKGLRAKKDEDASEALLDAKPSSEVIKEIESKKAWTSEISNYNSILPIDSIENSENLNSDNLELLKEGSVYKQQSMKLIALFNTIFNSENSKFEDYFKAIGFKENIHLQEDSPTTRFFLNAVSKRFRDVEGFAKRQTKDNKLKQQEIGKLLSRLDTKISMNGFQINDLVLFLPTRIDRSHAYQEDSQPWAAFNIGAPHYFLSVDDAEKFKNKDWMVGRVTGIKENKVTEANIDDTDLNPFQLSVGVMWYLISATEEHT